MFLTHMIQGAASLTVTAELSPCRHLKKNGLRNRHCLKMTEIERKLNDAMALTNINNGNPLCHNDNLCHHQIVILLEVVNDATP